MLCKHDPPRLFERSQGMVAAFVMVQVEANLVQLGYGDSDGQAERQQTTTDDRERKAPHGQVNNNKDLDVEPKKEEPGFFGSFWNQKTAGKPKKVGAATMESVSRTGITCYWTRPFIILTTTFSLHRLSSRNLR
jgi:hypothetical protein